LNGLAANNVIMSVCSDASGNIYTAGFFNNTIGYRYVAKWNGTNWSELGGINGLVANNSIWPVCTDPSGCIYKGGQFTNSSANNYVAKYCNATSIEPINTSAQIKLFPNPFSDNLTIKAFGFTGKNIEVKMYDIFGRVVLSQPIFFSYLKLNTDNFPPGVYFVKVNNLIKKVMNQ
jgi:hypothetical protein